MERVNRILLHEAYNSYIERTNAHEVSRVFCHHDMEHFLAVARLAMLLRETERAALTKELIYAAALLHDIGRWKEYETGEDHALVSAQLAPAILSDCGFDADETAQIVSAIRTHRESKCKEKKDLNGLLYRADKLSRPCFSCKEEKNCNWKQGKKNLTLFL